MKRIGIAILTLVLGWLAVAGMWQAVGGASAGAPDDGMCPDLTGDKQVLVADIIYVVNDYYETESPADLDGSGQVQVLDILLTVTSYYEICTFPTPGPDTFGYGGSAPPPWNTDDVFAEDVFDDGELNYSNIPGGAGGYELSESQQAVLDSPCNEATASVWTATNDDMTEGTLSCDLADIPPVLTQAEAAGGSQTCWLSSQDRLNGNTFRGRGFTTCSTIPEHPYWDWLYSQAFKQHCDWNVIQGQCVWKYSGTYDTAGCTMCDNLQTEEGDGVYLPSYAGLNWLRIRTAHLFQWNIADPTTQHIVYSNSGGRGH